MVKKHKKLKNLSQQERHLPSTYGSRFVTEPVPKYELPEQSMPPNVAYQLIHDELVLNARPSLNLASFVTTWMEDEAHKLIHQHAKVNLADEDEYPHVIRIQERCVNILARLFHATEGEHETAIGTATVGSSEAIMLAGLALKWNWRKKQKDQGKPTDKPNLVMGHNVQVVWEKFARYFDVEPRYIPIQEGRYVIGPKEVLEHVDENTIGVCAILGSTFTGEYEPIKEINDALAKLKKTSGLDIPLHVDAASGGFVAPFIQPKVKWDFKLEMVKSINVSGHKYGFVYPGIGWVLWRDHSALPEELIFHVNYLGGDEPTFNLNFSRPATGVIAQYYNFLRLGREGYTNILKNLAEISNFLSDKIAAFPHFKLVSSRDALPLVAFRISANAGYTAFQLSDKLRQFGWVVPAYTMPPNAEHVTVLRIVIRESFSREMADSLLLDIHKSIKALEHGGLKSIELQKPRDSKSTQIC